MKTFLSVLSVLLSIAIPAFADVAVSSPSNGATVSPTVQYLASSTTKTCAAGVAAMGVYVNGNLLYVQNGSSLNTSLSLNPGTYNTVVQEWDVCGGSTYTSESISVSDQAGVFATSPSNNSTVNSQVNYIGTATTTCAGGVAAMGVYVNDQLEYVAEGSNLNTQLTLSPGRQHTVMEEWDNCGGASFIPLDVTVQPRGTVLQNLQASGGWSGYGELPPIYNTCSAPCSGVDWSMSQGVGWPSLSGNATQFTLGGTTPYSDALWTNPIIGQKTSQNLPDSDRSLLPSIHNFTYDADVYVTDARITQNLEFDISMYMNGTGMIWGNQCDHLADGDWDIWDNVNARWVSTGAPCSFINKGWNHVTVQVLSLIHI